MAITGFDSAAIGAQYPRFLAKAVSATLVAGRPTSLWSLAGSPGAGSFDATLNGVALSATSAQIAGQIPFSDPGSGSTYLHRLSAVVNQPGMLLLADRLWHNGGYNVTTLTAQSSTTPAWPARDASGTLNGVGVLLACEVSAAVGAGTPTITAAYTNSSNTASRSSTNILATAASAAIGVTYFLGLQSGDVGVRSLQSMTLSATWTSGTINMVAYRILAGLEIPNANTANAIDFLTGGAPLMYNGCVPYLMFIPSTTTAASVTGTVVYTQG